MLKECMPRAEAEALAPVLMVVEVVVGRTWADK